MCVALFLYLSHSLFFQNEVRKMNTQTKNKNLKGIEQSFFFTSLSAVHKAWEWKEKNY